MANGEHFDILLDNNGDEVIANGDFVLGDGQLDDCKIIFKLTTGSFKNDPILGPNLQKMINSTNVGVSEMKKALKLHLRRDGKEPTKLDITPTGEIKFEL